MSSARYLFYIAHNYSFEILRPLQKVIQAQGDEVKWLAVGNEVTLSYFQKHESILNSIDEARAYNPVASFAPGNEIPNFIPGLKVQVFHGLEWKKKGHFIIRDFFDLYCTHGPATTTRFNQLANKHGFFDVVETGWPKLDYLFTTPPMALKDKLNNEGKKIILYAPTFSPALTSAPELFDEIKRLSEQKDYHWLIKFHPKMAVQWLEQYKTLVKCDGQNNVQIIDTSSINELLQTADIMVSDTSSVIGEFSLLNKAIVSLNNKEPGDYLVNIQQANQLENAIEQALSPSLQLKKAIKAYADDIHPYNDGQAAQRILSATEKLLTKGKAATKGKPLNLFRNMKQRKKLKYWTILKGIKMRLKRKYNTAILKNQLLAVIDLLEQHKVPYHLEGGTLLGIVRDKGIIPWDHDTDISIMAADFEKFKQIIPKIKNKNYRVKVKGFERDGKFKVLNKERIVKIKDKIFFFFSGSNTLDVFIKYPVENKVYWEAKQNTMCVDEKFYLGYEEIEWEERKVKVPLNYKEYLSLKYGDWNIINKEWDCDMELTIVEKSSDNLN